MKAYKQDVVNSTLYYAFVEKDMIVVCINKVDGTYTIRCTNDGQPSGYVDEIHYSEWLAAYEKAMQHIQLAVTNLHGIMVHRK